MPGESAELFIFARFHARNGQEDAVEAALQDVVAATREEAGNVDIHVFRPARSSGLFYIHSRWCDEAAFELHATLPHTVQFLTRVRPLIRHDFDVVRTFLIG